MFFFADSKYLKLISLHSNQLLQGSQALEVWKSNGHMFGFFHLGKAQSVSHSQEALTSRVVLVGRGLGAQRSVSELKELMASGTSTCGRKEAGEK